MYKKLNCLLLVNFTVENLWYSLFKLLVIYPPGYKMTKCSLPFRVFDESDGWYFVIGSI